MLLKDLPMGSEFEFLSLGPPPYVHLFKLKDINPMEEKYILFSDPRHFGGHFGWAPGNSDVVPTGRVFDLTKFRRELSKILVRDRELIKRLLIDMDRIGGFTQYLEREEIVGLTKQLPEL